MTAQPVTEPVAVEPSPSHSPRHAPGDHYRPDIDGLRAIAVIAVLLFHAFPGWWPGGFVGVDVFFVISGYLISRLILADLATRKFTFARFYGRRARRIFPALAAMLASFAIVGWLFLLPDEWSQFGRQMFAGAAFVSNVGFAIERAAYFDPGARLKPLLHLWSLGVEEQFYFVWPLLLFALRKRSRGTRTAVLVALAIGSFAMNMAFVSRHAAMTFYLPVTRLWELAIGSIAAVRLDGRGSATPSRTWWREALAWSGLVACVGAILFVHEEGFPGAWALAPTIGALLLITSAESSVLRRVLSSRAAVFIGLISYPLYLWHWPLITFARIWQNGQLTRGALLACLGASFVLAAFTYWVVETPIRSRPVRSRRLATVVVVLAIVAAIGLAAARGASRGRLATPAVSRVMAAASDWSYPFGGNFGRSEHFEVSSVAGKPGQAVLFIGDSHMEQYWPRLALLAGEHAAPQLRFATDGGCPPLHGVAGGGNRGETCDAFLRFATQEAQRADVGTVVFGAAWPAYLPHDVSQREGDALRGFSATVADLVARKKRVFVLLSSPASDVFSPRTMVSRLTGKITAPPSVPVASLTPELESADTAVTAAAARGGATVVDPRPWLCPNGMCPTYTPENGPVFKDRSHLRPFYIRQHAGFLDAIVKGQ